MNHLILITQDSNFKSVVEKFMTWKGLSVKVYSKATDIESWEVIEDSLAVVSEYHCSEIDGFSFLSGLHERSASTKLILVSEDLSIAKDCPFYYEILDGLFSKRSFTKMMPRVLSKATLKMA